MNQVLAWNGQRDVEGMEILAIAEEPGQYDYPTGYAVGARGGKHYLRETGFRWFAPQHGGAYVTWYAITPGQAAEWRQIIDNAEGGIWAMQEYAGRLVMGGSRRDLCAENPLAR